ncbi:FdrA family protein [Nocardioides sp. LHG3406-4]|uniref:FdrA family protein n=1 Tax=Nocardioides sp. LHG3406-4 TaxID=2804575 RepID=UPI003CE88515
MSTATHVELRPGAYADSVALLQVSRTLQQLPGVAAAQVAMATPLNVDVLTQMGFEVPGGATPNDLVVAVRLTDDAGPDALAQAHAAMESALASRTESAAVEQAPPRTTATALRSAPDSALVLVSVPGPNALVEAMDAVEAGCDVMVFSDNMPLDHELALKRAAAQRDVLVMGPDCGTSVIGGVGLGFANTTEPGPVGLVAASGTGAQQLLCLLDHAGVGVTHALGVGGRDLSADVRGLSTRAALARLDADDSVELVVLVSKPPADDVAEEIWEYAAGLGTPVELAFLGAGRHDLTAAAESALRALGREVPTWPVHEPATPRQPTGGHLRGLFVGGTLCDEAMLIATEELGPIRSNIPLSPGLELDAGLTAEGHTMVDFGDDELTAGRAHPMIDPTLRLDHLARTAADPTTGVLLLDVVLGHGAEPDPAALLAPAIAAVSQPVVVSLVGTSADPQGLDRQVEALTDAGAQVHFSNAAATRSAVALTLAGGTR